MVFKNSNNTVWQYKNNNTEEAGEEAEEYGEGEREGERERARKRRGGVGTREGARKI